MKNATFKIAKTKKTVTIITQRNHRSRLEFNNGKNKLALTKNKVKLIRVPGYMGYHHK